ncbi:MAG: AI-2E family transporter, partial [Solirubrobacterales bacterium]
MGPSVLSTRLIAKIVLVAALVVAALYFVYLIRVTLGLVLIAVFFALAVAPAVNWLDRRGRLPRWLAILAVYFGIGLAIFGIGLLIVPPLGDGIDEISTDFPGYVEDLRDNETFREYDDRYDITEGLEDQAAELPSWPGDAAGTLRDVTVGVFSSFVQLFSILVIAFFLLIQGDRILRFVYTQFRPQRRDRLISIADDISEAIVGYVFGNFVISVAAGLVTYV